MKAVCADNAITRYTKVRSKVIGVIVKLKKGTTVRIGWNGPDAGDTDYGIMRSTTFSGVLLSVSDDHVGFLAHRRFDNNEAADGWKPKGRPVPGEFEFRTRKWYEVPEYNSGTFGCGKNQCDTDNQKLALWTAPADGYYAFEGSQRMDSCQSGDHYYRIALNINNDDGDQSMSTGNGHMLQNEMSSCRASMTFSAILKLKKDDEVWLTTYNYGTVNLRLMGYWGGACIAGACME